MAQPLIPAGFESCFVEVGGKPIHYVRSKAQPEPQPIVVLVHGAGLSHRYLMPTAERLQGEFRVFVPDLPGFGLSHKPWRTLTIPDLGDALANWMDAMKIESAALVGNSVGCQVIVECAAQHADRVSRAVLQGPTTDPEGRTLREQFRRWQANRKRERPTKGPLVVRDYWECGVRRLYRTCRRAVQHDMRSRLPLVRCPTLVVRGSIDPIIPQKWAEEATQLLPDARLVVLPDVPHTANYETPDKFVDAIRPFLKEGTETTGAARGDAAAET